MLEKKPVNSPIIDSLNFQLEEFFKMHNDFSPDSGLYNRIINEVERVLIQRTLSYTKNIHIKAAKILGINRNTLRKKIKELKIE